MNRPAPHLLLALLLVGVAALALAADPPPYNLDRAIDAQNQLTVERPEDPSVWNDLGNLLTLKRHFDKAEVSYRKAIELDPEPIAPHFNLALLLDRRGAHRQALKELEIVVDKEPEHAWAHYQIGTIYQRWGLDWLAERSYARAFRLDPSLAEARINPHVLDNPLLERALLRAHKDAGDSLLPPRSYEEPGRIAALMIDVPKTAASTPESAVAGAEGSAGFARPTGASAGPPRLPAAAEETPEEGGTEPKRITTNDLEPGREVNQVVGGAVVGGSTSRSPQGRTATPGRPFAGRFRPGANQRPAPISEPPSGGSPAVPSFQPGTDSTGRLELRLLPPVADGVG